MSLLTERALHELNAIEASSLAQWGHTVAEGYIAAIQSALVLIQAQPGILHRDERLSPHLRYYGVGRHLLIVMPLDDELVVITIVHASIDLVARLRELQPEIFEQIQLRLTKLRGD